MIFNYASALKTKKVILNTICPITKSEQNYIADVGKQHCNAGEGMNASRCGWDHQNVGDAERLSFENFNKQFQ